MSSHHFVKEGQEPALVFANGQECSHDLVVQLMEWCPFIVALDGAYHRLKNKQIAPDVVIGDLDSIGSYEPSKEIRFIQKNSQEKGDLEKAILFLIDKGYDTIHVIWATGKRLDHTINNLMLLASYPKIRIVLYDDFSKAYVIPKIFSKVFNQGAFISLIPLPYCDGITTSNLKFSLKNESLKLGDRSGTSNESVSTGEINIIYKTGLLAIIESTD